MVHVVAGPPERPLLHRRRADEGPDEPGAAGSSETRGGRSSDGTPASDRWRAENARPPTARRAARRTGRRTPEARTPERSRRCGRFHVTRTFVGRGTATRVSEAGDRRARLSLLLRTLLLQVGRDGSTAAALRGSRRAAGRAREATACRPAISASTTTVTGLPSTPSRKAMRQPQASRACVNPFSIPRSSYHGGPAGSASRG